jgi:hypothetical protein
MLRAFALWFARLADRRAEAVLLSQILTDLLDQMLVLPARYDGALLLLRIRMLWIGGRVATIGQAKAAFNCLL